MQTCCDAPLFAPEDGRLSSDLMDEAQLSEAITTMAGHITAATARWLEWIFEFDRQEYWNRQGCKSMSHWLNFFCRLAPRTATEYVRVARALQDLPLTKQAFSQGEISYSNTRTMAKTATRESEAGLLNAAKFSTASRFDRISAKFRGAIKMDGETHESLAAKAYANRRIEFRFDDAGSCRITLVVPTDTGVELKKHFGAAAGVVIKQAVGLPVEDVGPDLRENGGRIMVSEEGKRVVEERGGRAALELDAAVAVITGRLFVEMDRPKEALLMVEPELLAAESDREVAPDVHGTISNRKVSAAVAQRWACDSRIQVMTEDTNANPLAMGHAVHTVNWQQRRALEKRDHGCCQFPGCNQTVRLHAHHAVWWSKGGPTNLDNLVLVCSFHHHKLHEGGFNARREGNEFVFSRPDGHDLVAQPMSGSVEAVHTPHDGSLVSEDDGWRIDMEFVMWALLQGQLGNKPKPVPDVAVQRGDPLLN